MFFFRNKDTWKGSAKYWNERYVNGGNSGAGSYNRLAEYKAKIINDFVKKEHIKTVIEWGCGDGNQLSLANYPSYIGYDVSPQAIKICKKKFKNDSSKKFTCSEALFFKPTTAELSLSLDVLYHLIEDDVFDKYMKQLFSSSEKYVIIYSCNDTDYVAEATHVKHRKFTQWVTENVGQNWTLKDVIKNKYPFNTNDPDNTSWSDFFIYEKKQQAESL